MRSKPDERSVSRFEKLYTMLLDSIPSSVLLIDRNLRIVSANQNFVQKARVGGTQVVDRRLEEVFPPFFYQHMSLQDESGGSVPHRALDQRGTFGLSRVRCSAAVLLLQPAAVSLEGRDGERHASHGGRDRPGPARRGSAAGRATSCQRGGKRERSRGIDRPQGPDRQLEHRGSARHRIRGSRGPPFEYCRPLPRDEPE